MWFQPKNEFIAQPRGSPPMEEVAGLVEAKVVVEGKLGMTQPDV